MSCFGWIEVEILLPVYMTLHGTGQAVRPIHHNARSGTYLWNILARFDLIFFFLKVV